MPGDSTNDRYYSDIHTKLVADENDLVGLIAYGLYKQEKLSYIEKYKNEHGGRKPTNLEIEQYTKTAELHIESYKEIASSRINQIFEMLYKEQADRLEHEYLDKTKETLDKLQPHGWWYGFFQGIASSFAFTLFLGMVILLLLYSQYGLGWLIQDIIQKLPLK